MKGTVKWFDTKKGYGFIECEGKEVLVYYTSIIDQDYGNKYLVEGEMVEFCLVKTMKGFRAKNVRTIMA